MKTPLKDALDLHIEKAKFGFHMPGHRGLYGEYDLTEVPGLDNLHDASEAIRDSQNEIARVYGAAATLMSTNGSTGGILAVLGAACSEGDKVVTEEGCHRSVYNALKPAGATAVRVPNGKSDKGVALPAEPQALLEAAEQSDAVGVVITRPNYYGLCIDEASLRKLADNLHEQGRFLFVDEAHGAHFVYNEQLPSMALECGADCVVQSVHKTLPAITQSALIHFNAHSMIKREDVVNKQKQYLTSSPSYLLMQSIEAAVAGMTVNGCEKYASLLDGVERFSKRISENTNFTCVNLFDFANCTSGNALFEKDESRLVINVSQYGQSGYAVATALEKLFGIFIEMADEQNLVLICMPGDESAEFGLKYLSECLIKLDELYSNNSETNSEILNEFEQNSDYAIAQDVVGKIAAGDIAVYPPGSPIIFEGEKIAADKVEYLQKMASKGAFISGLNEDGAIPTR